MKTIEQLIKENNINAESALGRGKSSSGDLGATLKNETNPLGLSPEQLALLNALVSKKPELMPPVK
jgi:hypothetical protein